MSQNEEFFLVIDAGTSGVKVGLGNSKGEIIKVIKTKWSYFYPEDLDPYGAEFDPEDFWSKIIFSIKEVIKQGNIESQLITCIAVTSQRHGCVFIDNNGKELYSGPNRDARGLEVDLDEYCDPDDIYNITWLNPHFLFVPTRYLWFKENDEEKFNKIDKILPINSWIIYKMTKRSVADITTASATQLLDLKTLNWSEKILDDIGLAKNKLPEIIEIGTNLGSITEDISSILGLKKGTTVTISGADTQSAIIGSGSHDTGDIIIVAGSTMPIVQLTNEPIIDSDDNLWSGCFFDKNKWLLEANTGAAGTINEWFVKTFVKKNSASKENSYDLLEQLASSHPPGSDNIIMDLGIQICNWRTMTDITPSSITFPSVLYSLDSNVDLGSFCHALLENISFIIRANIDLLTKASNLPMKNVFIVGGLSKSILLKKILASVLNTEIKYIHPETTIIGGLFACAKAKGNISSYNEFIQTIHAKVQSILPINNEKKIYEEYYQKWRENYDKQRENSDDF